MNSARIIVLGVAVVAGGVAAFLAASVEPPPPVVQASQPQIETADVLVAKSDIGIGQRLTTSNVTWAKWPANAVNGQMVRGTAGSSAPENIIGAISRAAISSGEPIRPARLITGSNAGYMAAILGPNMRAISVEITPETGTAGFILPNDKVDVILTASERSGDKEVFQSRTILKNIRLLAIDQSVDDKTEQKAVLGKIATLEVTLDQAETIALARRLGTLSLILRGMTEGAEGEGDLVSPMNTSAPVVIRFGQSSVR